MPPRECSDCPKENAMTVPEKMQWLSQRRCTDCPRENAVTVPAHLSQLIMVTISSLLSTCAGQAAVSSWSDPVHLTGCSLHRMLNSKNQATSLMLLSADADSCAYYNYAFEKTILPPHKASLFFVVVFFLLLFWNIFIFTITWHSWLIFLWASMETVWFILEGCQHWVFSLYNIAQSEMCVCVCFVWEQKKKKEDGLIGHLKYLCSLFCVVFLTLKLVAWLLLCSFSLTVIFTPKLLVVP